MKKLNPPTNSLGQPLLAAEVLTACVTGIGNAVKRTTISAARGAMTAAENSYRKRATQGELYLLPKRSKIGGCSKTDLMGLYTGQLARRQKPAYSHYEAIRRTSSDQVCPLCGVGVVSTLDHHLPKAIFAVLSITPENLVPACFWCQNKKRDSHPLTQGEQTLHPYFDDFSSYDWLVANVVSGTPTSFSFSVSTTAGLSTVDKTRLETHLLQLGLTLLFSVCAASELASIRGRLNSLFVAGGAGAVQADLLSTHTSASAVSKNSWRTAMYGAAAADSGFYGGGFLQT
jgi:hypothetical protein